jgi:bifunctional NMN adenylyltransferase/nudix hydrolase
VAIPKLHLRLIVACLTNIHILHIRQPGEKNMSLATGLKENRMSKKYDTLVLIGRFQPFHNAHLEIVKRATALCNKLVIVVGSARQPRTYKNPFTFEERAQMIRYATMGLSLQINIEPNIDTIYNDQAWAVRVQQAVALHTKPGERVGIIGHKKDDSSFYLDMFPQWGYEDVELVEFLSAVNIRDLYFKQDLNFNFLRSVVPDSTMGFLQEFVKSPEYAQIIREREFVANYKKQYASLPYPPIFSTADAVVIQSGHVLMIRRRAEPGKGLWALPGGYVNANTDKSVEDAAIRELREETGIKVPAPVLRGSIVRSRVFDAIDRSPRGRIITHAFYIQLPDGDLPKVKGMDDAEKARWVPIAEVRSEDCFEDHYEILQHFLGA